MFASTKPFGPVLVAAAVVAVLIGGAHARWVPADESPFVKNLQPGEREKIVYAWTRDADQKATDFLAVVDVDPDSKTYGTVINTVPTGSAANEAHHFGYTHDADKIFAAGMFTNKLFIYDVGSDPKNPKLVRTVDLDPTGYSGPHTMYALPDGMLVAMLGAVGGGGPGGLIKLTDDGDYVEAYPAKAGHEGAPLYMYDVGIKPAINRMISSSWAHPQHVKMSGGSPPEHTGSDVVVWDWETKKVLQVEKVDLAPLEVRWMHNPLATGGFTNAAYGSTVWYWEDKDKDGKMEFHRVIKLPENSAPADMRISYDDKLLYVSLFGGSKVQQYDIADPHAPKLVSEVEIPHPNMMKLTPDSKRLYVSNSLLSTMDPPDATFGIWLLNVGPEGMTIDGSFKPDFSTFPGGPAGPHDMLLK